MKIDSAYKIMYKASLSTEFKRRRFKGKKKSSFKNNLFRKEEKLNDNAEHFILIDRTDKGMIMRSIE